MGRNIQTLDDLLEDIKLIIWDLDETFWGGTLTEGGIDYINKNHILIMQLAQRGIMSSICSKNNQDDVEQVLKEKGLWDYFVFSSINWEPKGVRVGKIISSIQLRPDSILFIDDNRGNLEEVLFTNTGINVALPNIIDDIAAHARFCGKEDSKLSRLEQYKILEQKQSQFAEAAGDNIAFLSQSDIRVYIEYDIEKHIKRAVELINRTNQLNFTKQRLPEDPDVAADELLELIRLNFITAALIRVQDKFGDYGFSGIYIMKRLGNRQYLLHFTFSCRILNMHVEQFVYDFIGRPNLKVVGEVVSDVFDDHQKIDWIKCDHISALDQKEKTAQKNFDAIYARGGCDLASLIHYFALNSDKQITEFNGIRDGQTIRIDHSNFLVYALKGMTQDQKDIAARLGYAEEDFETQLLDVEKGASLVLLSFWADADIPVYYHPKTGLEIPYWRPGMHSRNIIANRDLDENIATTDIIRQQLEYLRENFQYNGLLSSAQVQCLKNYNDIFSHIHKRVDNIVLLLANERGPKSRDESTNNERHPHHVALNKIIRKAAANFPKIKVIDVDTIIGGSDQLRDLNHFNRIVYHRIYTKIIDELGSS
ncbi:MAG: HAD-IIIC family phosphatase [Desulfuromusa sp.]|nr:HAD-IIIC family phosphatase [Desulfuromusa sp.]